MLAQHHMYVYTHAMLEAFNVWHNLKVSAMFVMLHCAASDNTLQKNETLRQELISKIDMEHVITSTEDESRLPLPIPSYCTTPHCVHAGMSSTYYFTFTITCALQLTPTQTSSWHKLLCKHALYGAALFAKFCIMQVDHLQQSTLQQ
jgi:hypothetical protein